MSSSMRRCSSPLFEFPLKSSHHLDFASVKAALNAEFTRPLLTASLEAIEVFAESRFAGVLDFSGSTWVSYRLSSSVKSSC